MSDINAGNENSTTCQQREAYARMSIEAIDFSLSLTPILFDLGQGTLWSRPALQKLFLPCTPPGVPFRMSRLDSVTGVCKEQDGRVGDPARAARREL